MKKNLILGTGTGYNYKDVNNFVTSLKKINYDGEVTILVSDQVDEETKKKLLQKNINLIYADNKYLSFSRKYADSRLWKIHSPVHKLIFSWLNKKKDNLNALSSYVKRFHLISGSRYCFYYDYLVSHKDSFNKILITDIRDVVFQTNPFDESQGENLLNFYCEDSTIKDSFYTAYWIKHAFGKKELKRVEEKMSICSGTTIANMQHMMVYLEAMIRTQARITGGLTGLGGFDQGVHNYLIYNNYFPNSKIVDNYYGEVATLSGKIAMVINDDGLLIDPNNRVIPIVHQYDRFPDLKLKVIIPGAVS